MRGAAGGRGDDGPRERERIAVRIRRTRAVEGDGLPVQHVRSGPAFATGAELDVETVTRRRRCSRCRRSRPELTCSFPVDRHERGVDGGRIQQRSGASWRARRERPLECQRIAVGIAGSGAVQRYGRAQGDRLVRTALAVGARCCTTGVALNWNVRKSFWKAVCRSCRMVKVSVLVTVPPAGMFGKLREPSIMDVAGLLLVTVAVTPVNAPAELAALAR